MANKTVYPYGTGGSLPSSVGIINDLVTGGSDKALSAEQGKIIGSMIGGVAKNVVCTTKQANKGVVASNGLTTFGDISTINNRAVFGPVECVGYDYLTYTRVIQNNSDTRQYGIVFFDEDDNPILGYTHLEGSSANVSNTVDIPDNAAYFYNTTWGTTSSDSYTLVSKSKLEAPENLVNDLGVQFQLNTTVVATEKSLNFFRLDDGGVYLCYGGPGTGMDPRITLDLTGRDYSKRYKLTLKYKYTGSSTSVWCVYVTTIRQSGNKGGVFSPSYIPSGEGVLQAYLEPNENDKNFIQISSQSAGTCQDLFLYGLQIEEIASETQPVTYSGQKISLGYPISCKSLSVDGGQQGSANYGDFYFKKTANKVITVSNLRTGKTLGSATLEIGFVSNAHWNTINFGTIKYDASDDFPLIYFSTGYDSDGYSGCIVYRIQMSESGGVYTFTFTIVQTIKFPGTAWTEFMTGGNNLYVYATGSQTVYKFPMPVLSDGSVVILEPENATTTYHFPPKGFSASGQGCLYYQDKIYMVHGMPSESTRALTVQDLKTQTWATFLNLDDLGLSNYEPEGVFIWDGQLCIALKGACEMLFY